MTSTGAEPSETTILVVDDHDQVRLMVVRALREAGYRVLEAADGAAALDLLRRQADIRLVVTDVVMPRMSGFELADQIRSRRGPPAPALLFMSAHGLNRSELPAPILEKPFSQDLLRSEVRRLLM
jgi:CheY-like chemotaxis protein